MELTAPRQLQTLETKQRIYEAAIEIMRKKGFAYLTISNICKVAKVSNGTFFYHFKTKDELLTYYTYDNFARFREERRFLDCVRDLPFDERIVIFYCYWADYMEDLGLDFCTDFYHTRNYSLDIRRWNQREPVFIWNYPGECLSEAQQSGLLKEGMTVAHCAEVLGTLMKGVAFDWCLSNGAFEMKPRVREIMCPYLESIKKGKEL